MATADGYVPHGAPLRSMIKPLAEAGLLLESYCVALVITFRVLCLSPSRSPGSQSAATNPPCADLSTPPSKSKCPPAPRLVPPRDADSWRIPDPKSGSTLD